MNETAIKNRILELFADTEALTSNGDFFFYYNPYGQPLSEQKFPFITLVTSNAHDTASDLDRVDVFRLNIGVAPKTYRRLFGQQPAFPRDGGLINTGHDFTVLNQLMPHPVYAAMSWVCVLNPSEATFQGLQPLLEEAYGLAVRQQKSRA
jgi:Family of unknown function (DUF6194)